MEDTTLYRAWAEIDTAAMKHNLAVVRRDDAGHTISDADVISKCGWTPFDGTVMHHRVERTFVNGEEVFNAHGINGTGSCINESVRGSRLLFNV